MDIVAIGGEDLQAKETLPIDEVYGTEFGCRTERLLLLSRDRDVKLIREKILGADVVYVGGGNTQWMMKLWRRRE